MPASHELLQALFTIRELDKDTLDHFYNQIPADSREEIEQLLKYYGGPQTVGEAIPILLLNCTNEYDECFLVALCVIIAHHGIQYNLNFRQFFARFDPNRYVNLYTPN